VTAGKVCQTLSGRLGRGLGEASPVRLFLPSPAGLKASRPKCGVNLEAWEPDLEASKGRLEKAKARPLAGVSEIPCSVRYLLSTR
jgi:hypothetical protein